MTRRFVVKAQSKLVASAGVGAIVYEYMENDFGLSRVDSAASGRAHMSVTLDGPGKLPFFTIPVDDLEPDMSIAPLGVPAYYTFERFCIEGEMVFTVEEFRELQKRYTFGDGHGVWACAEGYWIDSRSGSRMIVIPHDVKAGKKPESFFTHIAWFSK